MRCVVLKDTGGHRQLQASLSSANEEQTRLLVAEEAYTIEGDPSTLITKASEAMNGRTTAKIPKRKFVAPQGHHPDGVGRV